MGVNGSVKSLSLIHIFDAETAALAASLLRIMFPMIIFTGAAYTLVGVLQSKNEFIVPSLISSISNAGVIFYFLFINDALGENSIHGLAFAYLIAWALQLLTLIIPLAKRKFRYYFCLDLKNPALRKALKMTPPIMIGSWLAPVSYTHLFYFCRKTGQAIYINILFRPR